VPNDRIDSNDKLARAETLRPILRYYPSICPGELKETTIIISQDSTLSGRDLNPKPHKYEAEGLTTRSRHLFQRHVKYYSY
jgi:hypothetical protein